MSDRPQRQISISVLEVPQREKRFIPFVNLIHGQRLHQRRNRTRKTLFYHRAPHTPRHHRRRQLRLTQFRRYILPCHSTHILLYPNRIGRTGFSTARHWAYPLLLRDMQRPRLRFLLRKDPRQVRYEERLSCRPHQRCTHLWYLPDFERYSQNTRS